MSVHVYTCTNMECTRVHKFCTRWSPRHTYIIFSRPIIKKNSRKYNEMLSPPVIFLFYNSITRHACHKFIITHSHNSFTTFTKRWRWVAAAWPRLGPPLAFTGQPSPSRSCCIPRIPVINHDGIIRWHRQWRTGYTFKVKPLKQNETKTTLKFFTHK